MAAALCAFAVWRQMPPPDWQTLGQAGVEAVLEQSLSLPPKQETSPQLPTEAPTETPTEAPTQPPTEPPTQPPLTHLLEAPETEPTEPETEAEPTMEVPPLTVDPAALEMTNSTQGIELELGDYLDRTPALRLSREGPQILILHTHTTEAYTMADGDNYTPSDPARTTDENYNMIRVGEEMKAVFEEMGLEVVHDKTLYDYPGYNGSYARSLKGIQQALERWPTISVVLDVHRDALMDRQGNAIRCAARVAGEDTAQVMLVVGTDDGGLEHPRWQDNLALAARIQGRMLMVDSQFPRPLNLRSQRFNQHMTPGSLLVEVGSSGNTLQEALAGARYFARSAGEAFLACRED